MENELVQVFLVDKPSLYCQGYRANNGVANKLSCNKLNIACNKIAQEIGTLILLQNRQLIT